MNTVLKRFSDMFRHVQRENEKKSIDSASVGSKHDEFRH